MVSVFNLKELELLLEDFYRITRIRFTVFDDKFRELVSFPEERPHFCRMIRSCREGSRACSLCDAAACRVASDRKETYIYRCHAGLTEAIMPLHVGGVLVGYLLFGHVCDYEDREEGFAAVSRCCSELPLDREKLRTAFEEMPVISHEYIKSAARILSMTASFLVLERMAGLQEDSTAAKLDAYLNENYTRPLTAEMLCGALGLGRSKLFKLSKELYGCGIQQQIKKLRMDRAEKLLRDHPDMSVMDIAASCGYPDYNYFISVFSRHFGKPPARYRHER